MDKKIIHLTEDELNEIIRRAVNEVLNSRSILIEMAVGRGAYIQYGICQSATVLKHIGKICVFEDDILVNHWVSHWEDEIAAQVYDLAKIEITKDNKACKIKKKAFIESFIEARLGKNFSEYDEKMPSYIYDALQDEGMPNDDIRKVDINGISRKNKERIRKYLFSFVNLLDIKDLQELKKKCKEAAYSF